MDCEKECRRLYCSYKEVLYIVRRKGMTMWQNEIKKLWKRKIILSGSMKMQ